MENLLMSEEWFASLSWVVELNEVNLRRRNRQIVRTWWMRPIFFRRQEDGNRLLDNIVAEQANETVVNFLRMKKEDFIVLLQAIRPAISRMNTNMRDSITAQERLLITLRYLATGETFSSVSFLHKQHSKGDVYLPYKNSTIICEAIDGKHFHTRAPAHSGSDYYNYKNFYSIVLLVMVHADYYFMFADAGGKGGISNGGIFRNSRLFQKLENKLLNIPDPEPLRLPYKIPVPFFILGDKAFAFTDYCIRSFGELHSPGSYQRIFNYRHSRARMPVENALGILANRFQVLKGQILLSPNVAKHIVLTTVYLHNELSTQHNSSHNTTTSIYEEMLQEQYTLHHPHSIEHSRARMPVENALGILANRFQVLKGQILLSPDVAKHIVLTTVYLNNKLSTQHNSSHNTTTSIYEEMLQEQYTLHHPHSIESLARTWSLAFGEPMIIW
uniref:DDE Tnp4 domain-containing protein n=1 Tax=Anopheles stephensi TaxID=30069 RepID=A0A182YR18_ANOST